MAMRSVVLRTLGAVGLSVALAGPALGQEAQSPPWRFTWTPIGVWGMGIEGPVTIRNRTRDLDVSFDELFDHLQGSFGTSLGASKGRVGGFFNLSYLKIGQDSIVGVPTTTEPVDFVLKWLTVELGGSYAVVAKPEVTVLVLGGVRYTSLKPEIVTTDEGDLIAEADGVNWTDPFIGAQVAVPVGEAKKLSFSLKGDVGGFDLSESTSKITWTVNPLVNYRFPISGGRRNLLLSGGYRFTHSEFTGEGPDVFQMDVDMSGPVLALTIVF
jgi:hypothetical protein